jgi:hypothetical protein
MEAAPTTARVGQPSGRTEAIDLIWRNLALMGAHAVKVDEPHDAQVGGARRSGGRP